MALMGCLLWCRMLPRILHPGLVSPAQPPLNIRSRRAQVVEALRSEPGLASSLPPQRVPALVEHNPVVAVEVRWRAQALWLLCPSA